MTTEKRKESVTSSDVWQPPREVIERARVKDYDVLRAKALEDPPAFWEAEAKELSWSRKWDRYVDTGAVSVRHPSAKGSVKVDLVTCDDRSAWLDSLSSVAYRKTVAFLILPAVACEQIPHCAGIASVASDDLRQIGGRYLNLEHHRAKACHFTDPDSSGVIYHPADDGLDNQSDVAEFLLNHVRSPFYMCDRHWLENLINAIRLIEDPKFSGPRNRRTKISRDCDWRCRCL